MTPDPQDRAHEALEHLQAAARELVAAARSALDVVEEIIDDPEALRSMSSAVGSLGDLLRDAASRLLSPGGDGGDAGATQGPRVERISVD